MSTSSASSGTGPSRASTSQPGRSSSEVTDSARRRRPTPVPCRTESVTSLDDRAGWDLLALEGPVPELADEVLTYGADVVVEGPDALRDEVVGRLRAVAEAGR